MGEPATHVVMGDPATHVVMGDPATHVVMGDPAAAGEVGHAVLIRCHGARPHEVEGAAGCSCGRGDKKKSQEGQRSGECSQLLKLRITQTLLAPAT